jgi:hypothetical protein
MCKFATFVVITASLTNRATAAPNDLIGRSLVLDNGQISASLTLEVNVAPAQVGSPTSIAPDLWLGITPRLTIGAIHSDSTLERIPVYFEPGTSICIVREEIFCPRRYHGSGLDGIYSLYSGQLSIATHIRFLVRDINPFKPALTLGAQMKLIRGRFEIFGDPYLQIGLLNTDLGNRAELWLPIVVKIQPTYRSAVELHTGYNSALDVWRDGYHIPLEVRICARVYGQIEIGTAIGFPSLLGPQNISRERTLFFDLGWRS